MTDEIENKKDLAPYTDDYLDNKQMLDYAMYAKHRGKIVLD